MSAVRNFRFVEPGLALSGRPEAPAEVDSLHAAGVRTVVSLVPLPEDVAERCDRLGIRRMPLIVNDWLDVPAGFRSTLAGALRRIEEEPAALVH